MLIDLLGDRVSLTLLDCVYGVYKRGAIIHFCKLANQN